MDNYKLEQTIKGLESFFNSLDGEHDIYKQIVSEEFFKFILTHEEKNENIIISSEKEPS